MVLSSKISEESGIETIENIVKGWDVNECWLHCTDFIEKTDDAYQFRVRWSIPTRRKPIPAATACVYFTIDTSQKEATISYVLEAQRLIHTPDKSVFREKWLKDIISTKTMMMNDVTF